MLKDVIFNPPYNPPGNELTKAIIQPLSAPKFHKANLAGPGIITPANNPAKPAKGLRGPKALPKHPVTPQQVPVHVG